MYLSSITDDRGKPSSSNLPNASSSRPLKISRTVSALTCTKLCGFVLMNSCFTSACSKPKAEVTPGRAGIRTCLRFSSRIILEACSGPAPPKAIKVNSRKSSPLLVANARTASAILISTTFSAPSAALSKKRSNGAASRS